MARIGLQSFFNPNQEGFTEGFARMASVQRGRKEAALGEIRKTLSEKQLYGAYAANANKILEDQIQSIAGSLDVDPTAYTDAVGNYLKYHGYSEQFKTFINDAATSYKADKEVDYNTALNAVQQKYVKTGSLEELEANIMNGVDAEKVLLETPGALKEDEVLKDRISKLGDIETLVTNIDKNLKAQGEYYFEQDTEKIKQKVNQAVEFDQEGNVKIKDIQALDELGITKLMLDDKRVNALVTQRLQSNNMEITEDNKKEALRTMMQPFATGARAVEREAKLVDNPEWRRKLEESQLALQRARFAAEQRGNQQEVKPMELMSRNLLSMVEGMAAVAAGQPQRTWKPYTRKVDGAAVTSPEGKPYEYTSDVFKGEMATYGGKQYRVNRLFMDEDMNLYMNVQDVEILKQDEPARREGNKMVPGRKAGTYYTGERIIPFKEEYIELGSTPSMQDEFNKFAADLIPLKNQIQATRKKPYQRAETFTQNMEILERMRTEKQKGIPSFSDFGYQNK